MDSAGRRYGAPDPTAHAGTAQAGTAQALFIVVSGPFGSGKTGVARGVARALAEEGLRVASITQPDTGRWPDGSATGFELELLSGAGGLVVAERLPLASQAPADGGSTAGLVLGRFRFEASSFARAEAFARVQLDPAGGAAEALCLDEIGRLELVSRSGLLPCLDLGLGAAASGSGPALILCSARSELAEALLSIAEGAGLEAAMIRPPDLGAALSAARIALKKRAAP